LGQTVVFEHVTPEFLRTNQHRAMLEQRAVDGLLLMGFGDFDRFLDDFDGSADLPAVAVDAQITRSRIDSIACDYRCGAQQAMNYLLQLGHRRIGLIAAGIGAAGRCAKEVSDVYHSSMATFGVRPGEGWIVNDKLPIHLVVRESTGLAKDLPSAGAVGAA